MLPACGVNKPKDEAAALRQWYGLEQDSLQQDLSMLDSFVQQGAALPQLQQQFSAARNSYKHVEGVVEYYFQGLTRRINGPALPDIHTEDNQVWPPHGFQLVEQYLYGGFADTLRPLLSNEIKLLQTDLNFVLSNLEATAILPRHVHEMVQHQLIRIATLGITGFDAPLSKLSLTESDAALVGLQRMLQAVGQPDRSGNAFAAARNYLQQHQDFDAFDRMVFLQQFMAPLSLQLAPAQKDPADSLFTKPFDGSLAALLQGKGFDPDFYTNYASAKSNTAKVALGKQLFYDNRLSKSSTLSCASCHQPEKYFTDGLPKAANGVHGGSLQRNTPSLFYASLQRDQFYDHRSNTLEDQVNQVMDNSDEFGMQASFAARKLSQDSGYRQLFKAAFGVDSIGGYQVRNAVAAYIRSLNPFRSRFDDYMRGNKAAMNTQELEGFNLFAGKAKCATCHFIPLFNGTVPPWFGKSESEIIGVPAKAVWEKATIDGDVGRYQWNQLEELRFAFKTPTVRNSEKTAPYMHNGVYQNLEDVVRFYQKGGGVGLGMNLPYQSLPFDSLQLNAREQQAVVAFLKTLTDR
ncbi:hypothetical protein BUE76_08985 [Cnuella takakiae]|nr:hypothetical protein BUE76_08985 [Cnuella takakiae]